MGILNIIIDGVILGILLLLIVVAIAFFPSVCLFAVVFILIALSLVKRWRKYGQ